MQLFGYMDSISCHLFILLTFPTFPFNILFHHKNQYKNFIILLSTKERNEQRCQTSLPSASSFSSFLATVEWAQTYGSKLICNLAITGSLGSSSAFLALLLLFNCSLFARCIHILQRLSGYYIMIFWFAFSQSSKPSGIVGRYGWFISFFGLLFVPLQLICCSLRISLTSIYGIFSQSYF